jgi:phage repressor protein C with HTH and peptisase S24 domain
MGASALLDWLEDSLSNALRVSERQSVAVDSFTRVLDRLYGENVAPVEAKPYVTHVPLYSLRAAAGRLGDEMESVEEDWVRAPEGVHADRDLFAAHVVGRSMEPRIPDGSLNLFRLHPAGSRQGKILLIEKFGALDETARYTVKRYTSRKVQTGEDEWRHEQIRLEPLNPEFEAWDVEPNDFAVVAEWLRVLE